MSNFAQAEQTIRNHVLAAAGGGLIPIPFLDIAAVTAVQLDMVHRLCVIYDVNFDRTNSRPLITALSSSTLARVGASAIKIIPGIGSLIGGVSNAILSGAATYAVGQVFLAHFEEGGTLANFNPLAYKSAYNTHFEEGKEKTKSWQSEEKSEKQAAPEESQEAKMARLKELKGLLDAEVITQEEFDKMRKKIIDDF